MIIWIIAAICAFFVKGLCGFANTLVFTSILSFGTNNVTISPVDLLIGFPGNIILVWKERKNLDFKVCLPLIATVLIGSVPGILFLKNFDASWLKVFFGALIIFVGIEILMRDLKSDKRKPSRVFSIIIGLVSGVLCGMYGVGALLGAYLSRVTENSGAFKANISIVFLADNIFRIIMYSVWGIITLESLQYTVILIPFMLLGLFLGMFSGKFLNEKTVKKLVIIMLIISGAAMILMNL